LRTFVLVVIVWGIGLTQSVAKTQALYALASSQTLTCATAAGFLMRTQDGEALAGLNAEYWQHIRTRLGLAISCDTLLPINDISYALAKHQYDFVLGVGHQYNPSDAAHFLSHPYAQYPYVVVAHHDTGLVYDLNKIGAKDVVMDRSDARGHAWDQLYPDLRIVRVDSLEAALERVRRGEAFAAVGPLPAMANLLDKNIFEPLQISGTLPEKISLRIMVHPSHSTWMPLVNQAISAITRSEQAGIDNRWIPKHRGYFFLPKIAYAMLLGVLLVLIAWLCYRARMLKKESTRHEGEARRLEGQVKIDGLTMVCNRQAIEKILDTHLIEVEQGRALLSVLFFDIDHFKQINDHYGHNTGDDVLIELSQLVRECIREGDRFGRWGGDEFLIVLPETSKRQAKRLAESIRTAIQKHTFGQIGQLRCSFGAASYRFGDTTKTLIDRVDLQLYEDKKHKQPWQG